LGAAFSPVAGKAACRPCTAADGLRIDLICPPS